eukprot:COSAG02_NODE_530_length_20697_cov_20.103457_4_plen_147_part_00
MGPLTRQQARTKRSEFAEYIIDAADRSGNLTTAQKGSRPVRKQGIKRVVGAMLDEIDEEIRATAPSPQPASSDAAAAGANHATANPQTCSQAGAVASDGTADTACDSDAAANTGGALNPEQCSAPQSEASADHKEIVANLRDCKLR